MKTIIKKVFFSITDILLLPFTIIFMPLMRLVRRYGVRNFPLHQKIFRVLGVFPVRDHYYEPQFAFPKDFAPWEKRKLHIDLDENTQLEALNAMQYVEELKDFQWHKNNGDGYYLDNPAFSSGDADMYYLLIRNKKPARIIEIGSGFSTKLALKAIQKNKEEGFTTTLTCIEPYEMPWLNNEKNIGLIRSKAEDVPAEVFATLEDGDILFIDSSHIIRPGNDVVFEYLQLLPSVRKGVLIHIHDIFTPRDYPYDWLVNEHRFWNEQYLLEAFLTMNKDFRVMFSLNHLKYSHSAEAAKTLIHLHEGNEPASFWIRRV